jgi:hypothetical protein
MMVKIVISWKTPDLQHPVKTNRNPVDLKFFLFSRNQDLQEFQLIFHSRESVSDKLNSREYFYVD